MRTKVLFTLLFSFGFFLFSHHVQAATVYVNSVSGNDTTGTGGVGSPYLTFNKGYVSSTAGDTLDLTGTFTWSDAAETGDAATSGYTLGKELTLSGHGVNQTIIQSSSTTAVATQRVFTMSTGVSTTITNLTIRYGRVSAASGGCINAGTGFLTLTTVEVHDCTIASTGSGAGIYTSATTTITNSSLYNNAASNTNAQGGAIYQATAVLYVTNSTIYNNTLPVSASGGGGAIGLGSGTASAFITNSTITGNSGAFGGALNLYSTGTTTIKNTIIAGNIGIGVSNNDFYLNSGAVISNGYNIIGSRTTYSTTFTSSTGDWTDTNNDNIYVLNGASTTGTLRFDTTGSVNDNASIARTVALLSGSIAINNATTTANGTIAIPSTDQRGATRTTSTDIGSFEYDGGGLSISNPTIQASSTVFSSVQYNQMTVSWSVGNGARHAVFMKQASSGTATPVDGTRYTYNVSSTLINSGDQIGSSGWYTIYDGAGGTSTVVTGLSPATSYTVQVFEYNGVGSGQSVYLNTTTTNNPGTQATYTPVTRYINSSSGNDTTGDGSSGAPYLTFTKGYASSTAGDTLDLTGTFNWSDSGETGDAATTGFTIGKDLIIAGHGVDQTIFQATSTDNVATQRVFTVSSNVSTTIQNATIRFGRITSTGGGCVYTNTGSNVVISTVAVYSCRLPTAGSGAGIYSAGTTTISNSSIYDNSALTSSAQGGGIDVASGYLYLTNSTVSGNTLGTTFSGGGGGVYFNTGSSAGTITNSTIVRNTGTFGGGLQMYTSGIVTIKNTMIASNTASSAANNDFYTNAGTITSNGYNIFGSRTTFLAGTFTTSTGDWTDINNDGIYNLFGSSTTGTLRLASTSTLNDSLYGIRTYALTTSSIAINNATSTANGIVGIPSTDQRGASRLGAVDIGAYEYGGTFDNVYHTLTYTAVANGSISGSSTQLIAHAGSGSAVTAVPNAGYTFSSWSDGTTTTSRTDTSVTATTTYTASFVTTTYTITYSANAGGTISGSSTQVVVYGASTTAVTATPNTGQSFTSWNDGATSTSRSETNVTTSTTYTASFSTSTYVVTYTAGTGGSITGSSTQNILYSASATMVTATPSTGYTFSSWSDGVTTSARTDTNVSSTLSLTASFTANTVVLTYTAGTGGTITGSSTQAISYSGSGSAVTATPSAGYTFSSWSDGVTTAGRTDASVTENMSVTASFVVASNSSGTSAPSSRPSLILIAPTARQVGGSGASQNLNFTVNNGATTVVSPRLDINLNGDPDTIRGVAVSLDKDFTNDGILPYTSATTFLLPNLAGTYTVYLKYFSTTGQASETFSRVVTYQPSSAVGISDTIIVPTIVKQPSVPLFKRSLRSGSRGDDVRQLQVFLNTHGFLVDTTGYGSPGQENIYFGPLMRRALTKFQEAHADTILTPLNLSKGTGIFGPATMRVVNGMIGGLQG